jgi:hypothetical protein
VRGRYGWLDGGREREKTAKEDKKEAEKDEEKKNSLF